MTGLRFWACLLLAGTCLEPAQAGSVEGPYLVWMNLGGAQHAQADESVREFINGPQRLCWPDDALLYMRKRPAGITTELVRRALLKNEAHAQRTLRRVLRHPYDQVPGFDGVVAYVPLPEPRLVGLGMQGALKSHPLRSATGELAWGPVFCQVMPPISRQP